ncbi:MAG: YifB family Mg chelatase-like AAA ATPase [Candidatus Paceibacterota bacterium]|jgi:magnesium chelatase family protein
MSFAKTFSAQTVGLGAEIIDVEVDLSKGLHSFSIVGLGDKAVEESRDRVSASIKNCGYKSPKNKNQKVVVSLAPADVRKEGPAFDVAISLAYLLADGEIKFDSKKKLFLGELSLDGKLRKINGVLPIVAEAKRRGFEEVFLPKENTKEAALVSDINIYGAENLGQIIGHLDEGDAPRKGKSREIDPETFEAEDEFISQKINPEPQTEILVEEDEAIIDFSEIKGQETAKRGLEIAAAGGHNIAMYGPPGTGKTMLAKAFSHILPPLSFDEILEITAIHSVSGNLKKDIISKPPVRAPHHTSSYVSLVGGGTVPKPGEVTLAHGGVLFLDEFPEFDRKVIEALREPLEEGEITISRARGSHAFPANFILIAAMNPCPCGNFGSKTKECICKPTDLLRYQRKISGPIVDRIDMWVEVSQINYEKLGEKENIKKETADIKKRVTKAREIQKERFTAGKRKIRTNSEMEAKDILKLADLEDKAKGILISSARKLDLSARAYHRVIKLARTIADLEGSESIKTNHILEALQYRPKRNQ